MSNFNSIIMKSKISMLLFVAAFAAACTNEMEEFAKDSFENVPENASLTRSCLSDTIDLGELVSLEETEELKELKARYEKMYSNNRKVQALDATVDDFFSSNIYAIRELPVTIKVRTIDLPKVNEANMYTYTNPRTGIQYIYDTENKIAFSHYTDDLDGDWILDDYGIRSWVESLPTKSISMATLANSYRIIGL